MEKLSIWNRLYGIAISVGTLIGVLFLFGCRTSRDSSTAVRSDSTLYNETVVSIIEPVPMRRTVLALTTDHLTRLTQLPSGFSLKAPANDEEGANLWVESDGKGGLNVSAELVPMVQKKDSAIKKVQTHIRDETTETIVEDMQPTIFEQWKERVSWMLLGALALMGVAIAFKKKFNNH